MVLRGAEYDEASVGWGLWDDTKKAGYHGRCDWTVGGYAAGSGDSLSGRAEDVRQIFLQWDR